MTTRPTRRRAPATATRAAVAASAETPAAARALLDSAITEKAFFRWTPSGSIDLGTVNPDVVEQFHIGDEFYVDFTPVK